MATLILTTPTEKQKLDQHGIREQAISAQHRSRKLLVRGSHCQGSYDPENYEL